MVFRMDEEQHQYYFQGIAVPNVTSIIPETFMPDANSPEMERARRIGKAVHRRIQVGQELQTLEADSETDPYYSAYLKFRNEWREPDNNIIIDYKTGCYVSTVKLQLAAYSILVHEGLQENLKPFWGIGKGNEVMLYHPQLRYAGTIDYVHIRRENDYYCRCFAVYLHADETYKVKQIDNMIDHRMAFISFLNVYNWNKKNL